MQGFLVTGSIPDLKSCILLVLKSLQWIPQVTRNPCTIRTSFKQGTMFSRCFLLRRALADKLQRWGGCASPGCARMTQTWRSGSRMRRQQGCAAAMAGRTAHAPMLPQNARLTLGHAAHTRRPVPERRGPTERSCVWTAWRRGRRSAEATAQHSEDTGAHDNHKHVNTRAPSLDVLLYHPNGGQTAAGQNT